MTTEKLQNNTTHTCARILSLSLSLSEDCRSCGELADAVCWIWWKLNSYKELTSLHWISWFTN